VHEVQILDKEHKEPRSARLFIKNLILSKSTLRTVVLALTPSPSPKARGAGKAFKVPLSRERA